MEEHFFDLNRIPENGQIVLMLSMSRLFFGQNAKKTYETILHLTSKLKTLSVDFYCVYTNGLYFNSKCPAFEIRQRTTNQMFQHFRELNALVLQDKKISPKCLNFLVWDSLILSSNIFLETYLKLEDLYQNDIKFRYLLETTSKEEYGEKEIKFVLEETVITYLLREREIELATFSSNSQAWRLLVYMGGPLLPDVYLAKNSEFNLKKHDISWFHKSCRNGMYDAEKRVFVDYTKVSLHLMSEEFFDVFI